MVSKIFFDSDVLLNAHSGVNNEATRASRQCVKQVWKDRSGVISTTVLRDFYYGLRNRKSIAFRAADARQCIEDYLSWHVVVDDVTTLTDAMNMDEQAGIAADSGLVLQAALAGGAGLVFSYRIPQEIGDVPIQVLRPKQAD